MIKLSFDNKKILNHFKGLIPSSSGCYFFLNKEKEIVYIGKAKNICKRVQSHFNKGRLSKFISFILYLDFIVTKNEKEALILEKKLITKHAPRFNFLLKDDTDYPYIEITSGDYPNYRLTRKPNEKFLYFGPFPNGSKAREILQVLERIFPLAKCKGTNKKKLTPCFYYSIDRCSGCCFKKIGKDYYDEKISLIKKFFSGDTKFSKKLIMRSIDNNIEKLSFEIAKKEKRILDSIDLFTSTQNIVISRSENCDFFCYVLKKKYLLLLISTYNNGTWIGDIKELKVVDKNPKKVIEDFLSTFYIKNPLPSLFFSEKTFSCIPKKKRRSYTSRDDLEIFKRIKEKALEAWRVDYLRKNSKSKGVSELLNSLYLENIKTVEFLDVSDIQGRDVISGFLLFSCSPWRRIAKSYYLLDNEHALKSDHERIFESCMKHYANRSQDEMPGLIAVDGGKQQIKLVLEFLRKMDLDCEVIGLVKDEKHRTKKLIRSDLSEIYIDNLNSELRNFLKSCQEKVHNFVLRIHRKVHNSRMLL